MRSNFHVSSFPMKGIRLCQCWHWFGHNLATICWMTTSMWIKEKGGGGGSTHPYACLSRSTQDYERDFILMNYSTKDHWDPTPFSTHMVIMDDKVCVRVCMHCVCVCGGGEVLDLYIDKSVKLRIDIMWCTLITTTLPHDIWTRIYICIYIDRERERERDIL